MTINEALCVMKLIRTRINELNSLRSQVSQAERYHIYSNQQEKVIEPRYDVKAVDKKITELELAQFKLDSAIKTSNARTELSAKGVEVDKLLEPLQ